MYNEQFLLRKADILNGLIEVCAELRGQVGDLENVRPALPKNELEMMLITIAAESSFEHRKQKGGGPARGLCGMEPATALDTFRWLEGKPALWERLTYIWLGLMTVPFFTPDVGEVSDHLRTNDYFSFALGRLHYKMFEEAFPNHLASQAAYWKKYWNTEAGAGTEDHAIRQWDACKCKKLMSDAARICEVIDPV